MPFLHPTDKKLFQEKFDKELQNDVAITLYIQKTSELATPGLGFLHCQITRRLLEEMVSLSPKLRLEVLDPVTDGDRARKDGIDKIPALILDEGKRLRFYGSPSGRELTTIVEGILQVSKGATSLSETTRETLEKLEKLVHIQVFVTSTCPWCPPAVQLAYEMALESPHIIVDVVETNEFPSLAERYRVQGVPKLIFNDMLELEGAHREPTFLSYVLAA